MGCNVSKEIENVKDLNGFSPFLAQSNGSTLSKTDTKTNSSKAIVTESLDPKPRNQAAKYRTKIDTRVTAKYDIKALIGKGSFSDVLRVESKTTREPFAIKVLKVTNTQEKELLDAELSVLKSVRDHPNIITLEEVIVSKENTYLVMGLATGGELYDKIKSRGYLDEKYSCNITQMLLDGLLYLHETGITHRDLKPENLLFYHPGNDSRILITDFGFAKYNCDPLNPNPFTTWCGTPEYISPELLLKNPYNFKVDLWSLGVIVYVMLSGHLPFSSNTTPRLFKQIVNGEYSFLRDIWNSVSSSAKNFISSLLITDPKDRLNCYDALDHQWIKSYKPMMPLLSKTLLKRRKLMSIGNTDCTAVETKGGLDKRSSSSSIVKPNLSRDQVLTNGLVLPFSGDFQSNMISKDTILDDNTSTMSQTNIDSMLATEDTDSTISNLGLISQLNQRFINNSSSEDFHGYENSLKIPAHLSTAPLKLSKVSGGREHKQTVHEQFEVIAEESEDDEGEVNLNSKNLDLSKLDRIYSKSVIDSVASSGSMKSAHIPIETKIRESYIEKVGVWLNDQKGKNEIKETAAKYQIPDASLTDNPFLSHQSSSFKSNFTNITTSDHTSSSFSRFLLPSQSRKEKNSANKKNSEHKKSSKSNKKTAWGDGSSGYESERDLYSGNSYTSSTAPLQGFILGQNISQ